MFSSLSGEIQQQDFLKEGDLVFIKVIEDKGKGMARDNYKDKFNYKNLQLNINFINTDFSMIDMDEKGLGFVNVGNICHSNSFIQVFFSNIFYWCFFLLY